MTSGGYLTVVKRDGSIGPSHLIESGSSIIGTASSCTIRILQNHKKEFASRQCIITVHPTETIIKNLSFETPTFVNNESFVTKVLINGDIITFGGVTFRWEYFNMGPRSNIPVKKSKVGPKKESFPIIKSKGSISRRKSDITIRKVDPKLKKILDSKRSSLSALSGSFTSNNRQVAVVKPQRRDVESSNDDEAALEVPIFPTTNSRSRPDNVLSGRRQSKRASAVSSPAYFQSSIPKKRKTNEVKKLDSPVVFDDHKKAALLMLTRTPGNRNILNKPVTPVALSSQPKTQEKSSTVTKPKLLKTSVKKTPTISSTSKVQIKSKIPSSRIARSAPPKSLGPLRTDKITRRSVTSAKKVLLPKYSPKSQNATPKLLSVSVTPLSVTRQTGAKRLTQVDESPLSPKKNVSVSSPSILKTSSSPSSSPRKSVAFESIPSPRSRISNVLSVSIEPLIQVSKGEKTPKTPPVTPERSPKSKDTPKSETTSEKRQSSRFSSATVSKPNTPSKSPISTDQNKWLSPRDRKSIISMMSSASKSSLNVTTTSPKGRRSNITVTASTSQSILNVTPTSPKGRRSNISVSTSASKSILSVSTASLKLRSSPSPKSTSSKGSRSSLNLKSPSPKLATSRKSLNVTQPILRSTRKTPVLKSPDQSIEIISPSNKSTLRTPGLINVSTNKTISLSPKTVTPASNSRSTRRSNILPNPLSSKSLRNRSSASISSSSDRKTTPTNKIATKPITTPYSTPSIRKSLVSKITLSINEVKVTTPLKKTPSPKSKSPSTMVTPVNRSLRNSSYVASTPRSIHKGVSRTSFKGAGKSQNELSIRALNLSDLFSDALSQNTPASTPLPKRNTRTSGSRNLHVSVTRLSRQNTSKRTSDPALSLSPIPSPKSVTRSPRTPTRSPHLEAINTTPELSKLFELEASTPKAKDGSRRSSRGFDKSSNSPISSRKQTRLSRFSKTEPRKQIGKKIVSGARKSLNLARKSVNVTPKSTFKLIPEILKEKHSTAKKSISKKFLIESRSEQKDVFSSPLRRKLSESLRLKSTTLADDLLDTSIANASFELLHGHSNDNPRNQSQLSPRTIRLSSAKSKTSSPATNRKSQSSSKKSPAAKNKSSISKRNISSKASKSPRNSLSNISGVKELFGTPRTLRSPTNTSRNVSLKSVTPKPIKTPVRNIQAARVTRSPKNDLSNISGVKELLKTPQQTKSPKILKKVSAVKLLSKSPKNDLRNVSGVKRLLKTPKPAKSPKNDLRNVSGVKRLLKTPKATKSPKNDLRDVAGVKRLLKTPKPTKSSKNDLRNVSGVKQLLKTPKATKSPKNDLRNVSGVKRLLKTPKPTKSPKNDLRNVSGVKQLLKTPKSPKSPKNDLRNVSGVKKLLKTPKQIKSPKNDLRNVSGVKRLLKTPKASKSPNLSGIRLLVKTPKNVRSRTPQLNRSRTTSKSPKTTSPAKSPKNVKSRTPQLNRSRTASKSPRTPPKTASPKKSPSSAKSKLLPTINTSAFYKKPLKASFALSPKSPNKSRNNLSNVSISILGQSTPAKGKRGTTNNLSIRKLSPIKAISSPPARKIRTLRKTGPVGIKKKSPVKKIKVTKKVKQELIAIAQASKKPNPAVTAQSLVSKKSSLKIDPENSFISVRGRRGKNNISIPTSISSPSPKKNKEDKKKVTFASDITTKLTEKPTRNSKRQAGISVPKVSETKKKGVSAKSKAIKKKPIAPAKSASVKKAATLTRNKKESPVKATNAKSKQSPKSIEVPKGRKRKADAVVEAVPEKKPLRSSRTTKSAESTKKTTPVKSPKKVSPPAKKTSKTSPKKKTVAKVTESKKKASPKAVESKKKASPKATEVKKKASPKATESKKKTTPKTAAVKKKVAPKVAESKKKVPVKAAATKKKTTPTKSPIAKKKKLSNSKAVSPKPSPKKKSLRSRAK